MRAGPRRNRIRNGSALALLGALALAMISGALLDAQPASASPAGFTGVSLRSLAVTNTPSVTDTPIATATDTPLPAPTATDTLVATNTPTPAPTATATPRPTPTTTTTRKTVLDINAAATYVGVQQNGNWCGIATIALIANYLYPNSTSQGYIANLISDPNSTSEWGAPTYDAALGYGPGVTADISRDFGTDPRSIAYGLTAATGWQYHAKVDTASAWDATIHIVDDMINTQQPISVFVDHGQHSVIVYGVSTASSTDNPVTNPSSITKIWVWDPGGGVVGTGIQPSQKLAIPISEWLSGLTSWANFYGSDYFKYSYASNIYGGRPLDPDPGVGPYTYVASKYNHLWIGHWVWVSASGGAGLNADWELNQYGALIRGMDGSGFPATPAGYTGSSVPMPNNQPPPPPPVQVFHYAPLPKPHPKPVPKPTPTPRPTATATPPRWRSSPTPDLPWPTQPPTSDPPPARRVCLSSFCVPDAQSSTWLMGLAGLLLFGALLSGGLMALRRRPAVAGATPTDTPDATPEAALAALAAGEAAPPPVGLMWLADAAPTTPADVAELAALEPPTPAEEAAPMAEAATPPAAEAPGPVIVPVLEADIAPPPTNEAPPED